MQPQEVSDASERLAFLALTDPKLRPRQIKNDRYSKSICANSEIFRYYDAVGPEKFSILEMLRKFAQYQGNDHFRPVHIGYRNMEKLLNVKSLGNLNRQFVSLLRSEQDALKPILGDPTVWESILGDDAKLIRLDEAFRKNEENLKCQERRNFPYFATVQHVIKNPRTILPGMMLSFEILNSYLFGSPPPELGEMNYYNSKAKSEPARSQRDSR